MAKTAKPDVGDVSKHLARNQPDAQPGAEKLAKEVNADWREFAQDTMARAWSIGVKLAQIKSMVRAEKWEQWCARHIDFGFRHVQKLVLIGSLPTQPKLLPKSNTVLNIDELAGLARKVGAGEDYPKLLAATLEGKVVEKTETKKKGNSEDKPSTDGITTSKTAPPTEQEMSRTSALATIGVTGSNVFIEAETLEVIFAGLKKIRKDKKAREELAEAEAILT
jgi:hypothetical protein